MPRRRAAAAVAALSLLPLLGARVVRAQNAPGATARRSVELSVVGGSDEELAETVRELLGRLGLRIVAATAAGMDDELARVQIDLDPSAEARVLVMDARTGEIVLRRNVARGTSVAIFREEVAHAVDEAIQSELLLDQDRIAATRASGSDAGPAPPAPSAAEPPPEPRPPPAPPPASLPAPSEGGHTPASRKLALGLDVTVLAGAGLFAKDSLSVARVAAGAVLESRRGLRPSVGLTVSYLPTFGPSSNGLDYRATVLSLRAMPAIQVIHRPSGAMGVGAGGGVDVLTVSPNVQAAGLTPAPGTTHPDPIVSVAVIGQLALASWLAITVTALCDFDLSLRHYVEQTAAGSPQPDVFVPLRVRPMLVAGFTFTALGEGVFGARDPR
jgi:hypothetical protein